MKHLFVILVLTTSLFAKIELIELSQDLDSDVLSVRWSNLALGGLYIDDQFIYLPHENIIYSQRRSGSKTLHEYPIMLSGAEKFSILRVLPTDNQFYLSILPRNGRFYLCSINRDTSQPTAFIQKHGYPGRLLWYKDLLYAGGLVWSEYGKYLDKYSSNDGQKMTERNRKEFKHLFEEQKGYTLFVYDENLNKVDSVNALNRSGENASGFMHLFMPQPFDIAKDGTIYLVDNEQGYIIERWDREQDEQHEYVVKNKKFKPLPDQLSDDIARKLKFKSNPYSCCYALYEKGNYVITAFYTAVPPPGDLEPPYYYDVSAKDGSLVYSGSSPYPLVGEDGGDQVFFYDKVEGGWFEDDRVFLVGMSITDVINGKASQQNIEKEIESLLAE